MWLFWVARVPVFVQPSPASSTLSLAAPCTTSHEAEDGAKAVQALQDQHHDMVFMDMVMPHMDGIKATRTLRANPDPRVAHTPIIGLTANVNPQDLARFETSGLNTLMLKPFEPEKLCKPIEGLLHQPRAHAGVH